MVIVTHCHSRAWENICKPSFTFHTIALLFNLPDPSILKFLQKRRQQPSNSAAIVSPINCDDDDDEGIDQNIVEDRNTEDMGDKQGDQCTGGGSGVAEQILGTNISEKWLHMDQIEQEKLEWMKDCQVPSAKKSGVCIRNVLYNDTLPYKYEYV